MSRIAYTPPEPVEVPDRPHLSQKQRGELFLAAGGRCAVCNVKIVGTFEVDHIEQRWLAGNDKPENLRVLCIPCHKPKTAEDAGVRSKVKGMAKLSLDVPREVAVRGIGNRGFEASRKKQVQGKRK